MKNTNHFQNLPKKPTFIYFDGPEAPQEADAGKTCDAGVCEIKIDQAEKDVGKMFEEVSSVYGLDVETKSMEDTTFYQFKNKEGGNVIGVAYDSTKNIYYLVDYTPFGQRSLGEANSVDDLMTLSLNEALENNSSRIDKKLKGLISGVDCEVSLDSNNLMKEYVYKTADGKVDFHISVDYGAGAKPVFHYIEHVGNTENEKLESEDLREVAYAVQDDHEKTMVADGRQKVGR